jgi:hypothetical protein
MSNLNSKVFQVLVVQLEVFSTKKYMEYVLKYLVFHKEEKMCHSFGIMTLFDNFDL